MHHFDDSVFRRVGHGSTELAEVRADFQPAAAVGYPTLPAKKLMVVSDMPTDAHPPWHPNPDATMPA